MFYLTKRLILINIVTRGILSMTEFINELFANTFGNNIILATILIAMVPIIELRGAIPFATNTGFWNNVAMTNWQAFGWSLLGSCLVVPILAAIFLPIINWLKTTRMFKKLAERIENRVKAKAGNLNSAEIKDKKFSSAYWKKMLGVFIFVAVPLPLTGVWTGTCIAMFIGLDYISACLSVISGNIIAGLIITLILQFFPWLNNWLFYIFLIIIAIVLIYELIRFIISKQKSKNSYNSKDQ